VIARIYSSENEVFRFALEDIYNQAEKDVHFKGFDFIILSVSPVYPVEDMNFQVKKIYGIDGDKFLAFHSINNIFNREILSGVTACFIKFEREGKINTFPANGVSEFESNGLVKKTADFLKDRKDNLNVIFAGLSNGKFAFFLDRLNEELEGNCRNIFGGVSSGYESRGDVLTYQFHSDKVIDDGFVILSFENVDYSSGIALGFEPVGPIYEVTESDGLRVYSIDGSSAVYLVERLLEGIEPKNIKFLWYTPVVILDDDEGYVSVLRTFKTFAKEYEDRFIEFYAPVYEKQHFRLSFATSEMLVSSVKREALKVKSRVKVPDLVFDFSCVARQHILGEKGKQELKVCSEILDAPIFGFSTYGEIGPDKMFRKLKLYNETTILVAVKER